MPNVSFGLQCCNLQNELLYTVNKGSSCNVEVVGVENYTKNNISVFPNPTGDIIIVKGTFIHSIELTDLQGQIVLIKEVNNNYLSMDIGNELKGIYFLKLFYDKGQSVYKIIKQ